MNEKEQKKLLDDVLSVVRKDFGKESVMLLGKEADKTIKVLPTEIPSLDEALGVGGIPYGRITELFGLESSGKTTIALNAVAKEQAKGGVVGYVDVENSLDPTWATKLGVDMNKLVVSQTETAEDAFGIAYKMIEAGCTMVVIDSIAAMSSKTEMENDIGEVTVGLVARIVSQAMRKLKGLVNQKNAILLCINQLRTKVGVMGWGDKYDTPGGLALKYYSSIRINVARIGSIKNGDTKIANEVKISVKKNKVAPPFREGTLIINFEYGLDNVLMAFENAIVKGVIVRNGNSYMYKDTKLGVGKEAALEYVRNNKDIYEEIKKFI